MARKTLKPTLLLLIAAGAFCLRTVNLPDRPMHNDEANQAYKFGQLLDSGVYAYDPVDHHGPTLYYLTLPVAWLSGRHTFAETDEATVRIVPVLFGVALILLLWAMAGELGWWAALTAGLLTAVSPAMVFYSSFYVQEMLLVFFTSAALLCGWRYAKRPNWAWAAGFGLSIGLMHATKETCVLAYAAMAGALGVLAAADQEFRREWRTVLQPKHLGTAVGCTIVISLLFFSSFLTHARGPVDSVLTYLNYLGRAGGAEHHQHPSPLYYVHMLAWTRYPGGTVWSEGAILVLALVGGVAAWCRRTQAVLTNPRLSRFLSAYALLLMVIYSLIPYKTPWCMLSFLAGLILLAGIGTEALLRLCRPTWGRVAIAVALAGALFHLGTQARRATGRYRADPRNPYVYAHTGTDFMKLVQRIEDVQACDTAGRALPIHVIAPADQQWPLPFYLRRYPNLGFWSAPENTGKAPAFVVGSIEFEQEINTWLGNAYTTEFYGLRPEVLLSLWIRHDLWDQFMTTRERKP
ncbi:MAG: TIGR03663 family protein [Lentisphaerae bacterium]|jgi:uncharacterized protein (TIGR03663 family)|nr:TIGR03663 family protein [Lentisphaerota bacterium]MBT4815931.1 TIGR03663 family protein [Lentisphaerota bacterium]MBT5608634.1 TIGR03663 family protein [Lentisphaerota bacterium]MBT7057799.1 TIGR03663 family protein [Lentisphaerota bacterium]MBT7842902.1 TIGR03663 family protein [Lentisphaerota bacterium]